jgi:RNA polymerase sigma factor (TIGR02999 family)
MPDPNPGRLTEMLNAASAGDGGQPSLEGVLPLVYDELRAMADRRLLAEQRHPTLSPTELVHEAYLRMADTAGITARGKAYFFAAAAQAMRRIVVDRARRRRRLKRGGGATPLTLHDAVALTDAAALDVLELEEGLDRLARIQERAAKVVEYRFYGGLSVEETAEALGVSTRTVDRDWQFARAWLFEHLRSGAEAAEEGPA